MLSGTYLHSCFCALSSCLSESAFNFYRLLGYGGQEVFAAACLWVIFSKLKRGAGKKKKKKNLSLCKYSHPLYFLSQTFTDQRGKGSQGLFLMCHSISVVTLSAHPLGQQVLTAQTRIREKSGHVLGRDNRHLTDFLFKILSYFRAVCRHVGPKKEVLSLTAFFRNWPV